MTKRKHMGSTLSNIRKSTLGQRTTIFPSEQYDTTIATRIMLMEKGYIKPGDSQYDRKLLPKKTPAPPKQET